MYADNDLSVLFD